MKLFICLMLLTSISYGSESIKVLALFNGKAYLNISGENKLLSDGQSYKGITLIQATSRWAKIKNADGVVSQLGTQSTISNQYKKAEKKSLKIYPNKSGMYQVNGFINNSATSFLVDTGATYVAMSERHAKKLGINYKKKGKKSYASTASGVVATWELLLDSVEIGGMKESYVPAAVIFGDHPYQVLLGMSYLKNLNIQHSGGVMLLQKKY